MTEKQSLPLALDPPSEDAVPITLAMVTDLLRLSRKNERGRMLLPLHKTEEDLVHRMFNAIQPGSYIPPHRHFTEKKTETILVITGALLYIEFSETGDVVRHIILQPGTQTFGIDIAPNVYHTFFAFKEDTLIFETKTGPYQASLDKDIPEWAPKEGDAEAGPYIVNLIQNVVDEQKAAADEAERIAAEQDEAGRETANSEEISTEVMEEEAPSAEANSSTKSNE